MSLMDSQKPTKYRWQKGDLISAHEACELLGYKSGRNLQDRNRRQTLLEEFARLDCPLTLGVVIGGSMRFLRSEFEAFITAKVEAAQKETEKRRRELRLVA